MRFLWSMSDKRATRLTFGVLTLCLAAGLPASAQTSGFYAGSIVNGPRTLSATATVTLSGGGTTMTIVLTNTTSVAITRADLLSTFLFNIAPTPTVTVPANGVGNVTTALTSGSSVVTSTNTSTLSGSQAVNGSFVFGTQIDADNTFKYGVSSSGYSNPGSAPNAVANGTQSYSFAGFGLGNGGDDYLLVNNASPSINGGAVDLIKTSATITITGFTGLTSVAQLTSTGFGFASGISGTTYVIAPGTPFIPEPGTLPLVGASLAAFAAFAARRKAKK